MYEVWSSPLYQWFSLVLLGGFGILSVVSVRGRTPNKSWLTFAFGLFLLFLAYPRRVDRPLFGRPMLLAALREDGIESEWPVPRRVPYAMVESAYAHSRRHDTYVTIVLDQEAPHGREFDELKLRFDTDAEAADFIASLERRTGIVVEISGLWLRHKVNQQRPATPPSGLKRQ